MYTIRIKKGDFDFQLVIHDGENKEERDAFFASSRRRRSISQTQQNASATAEDQLDSKSS